MLLSKNKEQIIEFIKLAIDHKNRIDFFYKENVVLFVTRAGILNSPLVDPIYYCCSLRLSLPIPNDASIKSYLKSNILSEFHGSISTWHNAKLFACIGETYFNYVDMPE